MPATERTYRYWSFQLDDGLTGPPASLTSYRWDSNTEITEGATIHGRQKAVNVQVHEATYRVGEHVEVHAFGRWRPGDVDKLNPKKVVVTFRRNRNGDLDTRSFGPTEIRKVV